MILFQLDRVLTCSLTTALCFSFSPTHPQLLSLLGINDNGSGAAAILEMALQLYRSDLCHNLKNKIRFSWYGAEEVGLKGSSYYVQDIMANDPGMYLETWISSLQ